MQKMMRQVPDEQAWRDLVERQAQSGLSVQEFCRREGLKAWSLYEWRSRLRARGEMQATTAGTSAPAASFIDLGAIEPGRARCEVRIDLGGGVVLHVVRG